MIGSLFPAARVHTASCVSTAFSNAGAAVTVAILSLTVSIAGSGHKSNIPDATCLLVIVLVSLWYLGFLGIFAWYVPEAEATEGQGQEGVVCRVLDSVGATLGGEEMRWTRRYLIGSLLVSEAPPFSIHTRHPFLDPPQKPRAPRFQLATMGG
jgi:hypothetical protein